MPIGKKEEEEEEDHTTDSTLAGFTEQSPRSLPSFFFSLDLVYVPVMILICLAGRKKKGRVDGWSRLQMTDE